MSWKRYFTQVPVGTDTTGGASPMGSTSSGTAGPAVPDDVDPIGLAPPVVSVPTGTCVKYLFQLIIFPKYYKRSSLTFFSKCFCYCLLYLPLLV